MGNITRDPELRVTPQGISVCKITLAISRPGKNSDGASRDEVTFVDVDCFGKQAEIIAKYMTKGKPILVEGRLRLDQWETPAGEKRSKLGVVLEGFQFVGARSDNSNNTDTANTSSETKENGNVSGFVQDLSNDRTGASKRIDLDVQLDEDVPF